MVSSTATKKAVMPKFTGKYASIRKNFWKATQVKYSPNETVYINGKFMKYKTETGFRTAVARKFKAQMKYIDKIEDAGTIVSATINVWYPERSQQARARVYYTFVKNGKRYTNQVTGGPTHGWGYDKMSTALADAFTESPEFMKLLMDARARSKKLPYGVSLNAGKPYFPHWDGGVGVSCFVDVLKACGYNVKWIPTGIRDSETYEVTLKRKRTA